MAQPYATGYKARPKNDEWDEFKAGSFSSFLKGIATTSKRIVQNLGNTVKPTFSRKLEDFLSKYGDIIVDSAFVKREPVQKFVKTALDVVTVGQFSNQVNKSFDEIYHLYIILICLDQRQNIRYVRMEKNEVINIEMISNEEANKNAEESQLIESNGNVLDLMTLCRETENRVGTDKYIKYDALSNNCQNFIWNHIVTMQNHHFIVPEEVKAFVLQDVSGALRGLTKSITEKVSSTLTDVAGFGKRLIGGKETNSILHSILIPMESFTKKQANDWIVKHKYLPIKAKAEGNFYRYRIHPQIKGKEFYTKVLPNGVQLVLQ